MTSNPDPGSDTAVPAVGIFRSGHCHAKLQLPKIPFRNVVATITLPEGMTSMDLLDREDRF